MFNESSAERRAQSEERERERERESVSVREGAQKREIKKEREREHPKVPSFRCLGRTRRSVRSVLVPKRQP